VCSEPVDEADCVRSTDCEACTCFKLELRTYDIAVLIEVLQPLRYPAFPLINANKPSFTSKHKKLVHHAVERVWRPFLMVRLPVGDMPGVLHPLHPEGQ